MEALRKELDTVCRKLQDLDDAGKIKTIKRVYNMYKGLGANHHIELDAALDCEDVCDANILRLKARYVQTKSEEPTGGVMFLAEMARLAVGLLDSLGGVPAEDRKHLVGLVSFYLADEAMRQVMRKEKVAKRLLAELGRPESEKYALCALARFTDGGPKFVLSAVRAGLYKRLEKYIKSCEDEFLVRCCVRMLVNMCQVHDYALMLWFDGVFELLLDRLVAFLDHLARQNSPKVWAHAALYADFIAKAAVTGRPGSLQTKRRMSWCATRRDWPHSPGQLT